MNYYSLGPFGVALRPSGGRPTNTSVLITYFRLRRKNILYTLTKCSRRVGDWIPKYVSIPVPCSGLMFYSSYPVVPICLRFIFVRAIPHSLCLSCADVFYKKLIYRKQIEKWFGIVHGRFKIVYAFFESKIEIRENRIVIFSTPSQKIIWL